MDSWGRGVVVFVCVCVFGCRWVMQSCGHRCDCVCGYMGVLAVNGKAVTGRNIHNDHALNQSQKQCFKLFDSVLFHLYTFTFVTLNCLIVLFWQNSSNPKGKCSFYVFIMTNKVFFWYLYCIFILCIYYE